MSIIQDLHEARQARLVRLGAIPNERRGALERAMAEKDELIERQRATIERQRATINDFEIRLVALEVEEAKNDATCEPTPAGREPSIDFIIRAVASRYKVTTFEMRSERKTADIVRPRQIAMYLSRTLTSRSLPTIGHQFGGRDHTTALFAFRKIQTLKDNDPDLAIAINALASSIMGHAL